MSESDPWTPWRYGDPMPPTGYRYLVTVADDLGNWEADNVQIFPPWSAEGWRDKKVFAYIAKPVPQAFSRHDPRNRR